MTLLTMLGTDTVIRWRPTFASDGHGNQKPVSWDSATITPAQVEVTGTSENTTARDQIIQTAVLRLPIDTDVNATDEIEWRGTRYQVNGDPAQIRSRFTPLLSRTEVNLTTRSG